jgi:hypothetical protein
VTRAGEDGDADAGGDEDGEGLDDMEDGLDLLQGRECLLHCDAGVGGERRVVGSISLWTAESGRESVRRGNECSTAGAGWLNGVMHSLPGTGNTGERVREIRSAQPLCFSAEAVANDGRDQVRLNWAGRSLAPPPELKAQWRFRGA